MAHQFSIGQFAKLTGLTPRALRIYAKENLLQPEVINPETGYRYYSQSQSLVAERIRLLRSIDMPLGDIREVLSYPGTEICQELLQGHKQRIEAQLSCYQEALQTLEDLNTRDINAYPIATKDVAAQPVIYVRRQTSLLQIETVRARAFGELYGFLKQEGLSPTGPGFSANAKIIDNACIQSQVWPAGKVAYVLHTGPYEPLFQIYQRLTRWLTEQGLEPTGQTREIYHLSLAETQQRNSLKTELQFYIT
jgi:DNA-binding transcriptional MerR regulator